MLSESYLWPWGLKAVSMLPVEYDNVVMDSALHLCLLDYVEDFYAMHDITYDMVRGTLISNLPYKELISNAKARKKEAREALKVEWLRLNKGSFKHWISHVLADVQIRLNDNL